MIKRFKKGDVFNVETEVQNDPQIYHHKFLTVTARRGQIVYFADEHGKQFKEMCFLRCDLLKNEHGEMIGCCDIGTIYAK